MLTLITDPRRCTATTKSGAPCKAYAHTGSEWCLSHDPGMAERLNATRRLGGIGRRRRPAGAPADVVRLRTMDDVLSLLERAARDAERLDHGVNRTRAQVAIAEAAARVIETHELERRLEELEDQLSTSSEGRQA